jgi:hypothetical protein
MPSLRFAVEIEKITTREVAPAGMSHTSCSIRVTPPTSLGEARLIPRDFPMEKPNDVEDLNRAIRLHSAGSTVVEMEWPRRDTTRWWDGAIKLALEQYATRPPDSPYR